MAIGSLQFLGRVHRVLGYQPLAPQNALASFFLALDQESVLIKENWQRVLAGPLLVLLVSGVPGIGKARLIEKLVRELGDDSSIKDDSITVLEADCTPYSSDTPFSPQVALMRSRLGLEGLDPLQQLEKVSQRVSQLGLASQEALPLLAQLLAIEINPAQWPIQTDFSALRQRQRTMDILQDAYCLALSSAHSQADLSLEVRGLNSLLSYRQKIGGETIGLLLELRQIIERLHAGGSHPDLIRATSRLNLQSSCNSLCHD